MATDTLTRARSVRATLNYLLPQHDKPVRWNVPPPPGVPVWNGTTDPREVEILDARHWAEPLDLETAGFAWRTAPTAVRDFYHPGEIARVYYPEVEALLRETLGALKVVVFDHNVRNAARAASGDATARDPVQRVHNDYTYRSAQQRVRDLLGDEAERWLAERVLVVNVWRPIRGPVLDAPLALCDARTISDDDLVATDLVHKDRVGETFSVTYSPRHRWFYVPRLTRDEVLLIKGYDSETDGRARLSFHSAFADPTTPPDAPPRESIEVRTLVFLARERPH